MLLDVWGWFIITTAAGIAAAAKNFAVQALHGNSPRSNIKIRLSKMLRELNKYVTLCGNKVQVSSKKHLFHEIIEITMLKPKPYGPMALDDYAQSVALALQYITWLKRFVSYQDWLCTPRPEVNPFTDPTWVFNIHWGSIWGCSWAAPWAPHFAYGHGNRQTG